MPYPWILKGFLGAYLAGAVLLGLCTLVPSLRGCVPRGRRMLLGSGVGFVLANLVSALLGVVPAALVAALHVPRESAAAQLATAFVLLGLFVGPLVVSPLGLVGGAWLALRRAPAAQLAPVRQ